MPVGQIHLPNAVVADVADEQPVRGGIHGNAVRLAKLAPEPRVRRRRRNLEHRSPRTSR